MLPFRHLPLRTLVPLAEGDRTPDAQARRHLAACARCRVRLQELRALTAAARALPVPTPSDGLLARVHARVASGERLILPHAPPIEAARTAGHGVSRPASRTALRGAAAVLALAGAGLWFTRPTRELEAAGLSGTLRFTPAAPRAGDSIAVEYRAPVALRGAGPLVLRVRTRTRWDEAYNDGTSQHTAAVLRRAADGVYRAGFRVPDSVVFAVFAVEDTAGRQVDSRGRRLWELLTSGPDGRPTADALRERENDLMGRNMELAFATARRRTDLYPDDPSAWADLYFHETINLGAGADSTVPAHRARLARMSRTWATRPDVPFAVVDGLLGYAAQVTDSGDSLGRAVGARWRPVRERATAVDPIDDRDAAAVGARWWRINSRALPGRSPETVPPETVPPDTVRAALAEAERFWRGAGRRHQWGARIGLQIARLARDTTEARLRWADRFAAATPGVAEIGYADAASEPALRRRAVARLAALAEALQQPSDARRPLELTRAEAARVDSARARAVLGVIGNAFLAGGDTVAARDAFARATADGWDVPLFRRAAVAHLATGDTSRGVLLLARVAADPGTASPSRDSLAAVGRRVAGSARWEALLAEARRTMRAYVLAASVRDPLPRDVALVDAAGAATTLDRLTRGRVSVVGFWSRNCGWSRQQMPALGPLAAALARHGAAFVPIGVEAPSPAVAAYLAAQHVATPVYLDRDGAARRAFGQWSTPEYYVLDAAGRVRFRHSTADAVLAQAVALTDEREPGRQAVAVGPRATVAP